MPVPIEFIRGVLGILCLFFAYMAGKAQAGVRRGRVKLSRFYAWLLRSLVCAAAMGLRHNVDTIAIAVWTLAVTAFAAGIWEASREKKSEDLTDLLFPHEE